MSFRIALLCLLLLSGCLRPGTLPSPGPDVVVPVPTGTISVVEKAIGDAIRKSYLETAALQDAGGLATIEQMIADETARFDSHFDKAVQALADREKAETQPNWTPKKSAAYRRSVAGER